MAASAWFLRRGRDTPFHCERGEKGGDVLGAGVAWIAASVIVVETVHSVQVGLLGARAQVPQTHRSARTITEARRLGRARFRRVGRAHDAGAAEREHPASMRSDRTRARTGYLPSTSQPGPVQKTADLAQSRSPSFFEARSVCATGTAGKCVAVAVGYVELPRVR